MNFDHRVLATHSSNEVGNHARLDRFLDDLEYCCLLFGLAFVGVAQQLMNAEVLLVNAQDLNQRRFRDFRIFEELE